MFAEQILRQMHAHALRNTWPCSTSCTQQVRDINLLHFDTCVVAKYKPRASKKRVRLKEQDMNNRQGIWPNGVKVL